MAGTQIALIRGINIGRAKRVAMAELRALIESLGYSDVRTLLNSGNAVFVSPPAKSANAAARIEKAMATQLGVSARITVISAAELDAVVTANPLIGIARIPARLMVSFLADPADRKRLLPLAKQDWGAEKLAVGARVAYLWCPDGILESPLTNAVSRQLGDGVTSRNWQTVTKLHALCERKPK